MSSGPQRRFASTVALSLLSLHLLACGSAGEPIGDRAGTIPPEPTTHSGTAAMTSCTPSVALGDPVATPLPSFTCPSGWDARSKGSALLVSGRFQTAREMVDALCTQSTVATSSADGEPAGIGIEIDFETSDVLAVASDGEVALHRRAGELWIRHTETCERTYRTALFVVPKNADPLEQTCSSPCE
jgi:hypothetical protein